MFSPEAIQAVAPRSAPVFTEYTDGDSIGTYVEGLRASNETTKAALLAIIALLARTSVVDPPTNLSNNCKPMFDTDVAEAINDRMSADPDANPTPDDKLVELANTQVDIAQKWVCDLVNASKKKELSGDNVKGYYESLGRSDVRGAPIATIINQVANFLPDMINDENFRNGLTDNVWTSYHTSRVSTGKLLFEIREDFIALNIMHAGDDADTAIIASKNSPHDIALSYTIPKKLVGYASLFYQVAGVPVGHWYQGIQYEATLPVARVSAIKNIFKKYLTLKNQIGEIDQADNIAALNGIVGDEFW